MGGCGRIVACHMHPPCICEQEGSWPGAVAHPPCVCERDFESEDKAVEGPQLHMVRAMCEASWPAQKRQTEPDRASTVHGCGG
jgi:hypothetical protein